MKYCFFLAAVAIIPAWGQAHPDLGGVWLPNHVGSVGPSETLPFLASAKAKFQQNSGQKSETDARCLPPGVPRIMFQSRPFEIVQAEGRILFLYEGGGHVWRQVWMDGRAHPKDPNPDWLGHSIGHWEGDTLVVDSVGFNDRTWLDDAGHPHTEQLHVIEKFTRTNTAKMKYEVTIDDPGAYAQPWSAVSSLNFRPDDKIEEDICLDKVSK
ncbi:MAG: hypothetical protein ACLPWF_15670 [Bryobacteraceae bacterium]